ncbi:MAG: septation regulator SpoVG [Firmicutes bacterium]|nr:septation regulator SpoVG [Bacillota bacterium]
MEITDVRVRKVSKEGKMKAVVSVTFDNEFVVHDIKVIEGDRDLFIAMPSRRAQNDEFRDIAHPINSATRDKIQTAVLEKYELALLVDDLFDDTGEAASPMEGVSNLAV